MPTLWQKFVYGAPAFAPMLFADVATLAALGLWALERSAASAPAADRVPRGVVVTG
jgi:hypothetical protein